MNISKFINVLLNPISPFITLVVGFLLNILTIEQYTPSWLKNIFQTRIDWVLNLLVLWFIFAILHAIWTQKQEGYEQQIEILKHDLEKKERQIENNSGILFNKYGELARFNKKQKFLDFLKSFVESNYLIESGQIYSYTTKVNEREAEVKIRLKFEEGFAFEQIEINSIMQSYFIISLEDYKKISEIVKLWKLTYDDYDYQNEEILKKIFDDMQKKIVSLFGSIYTKLEKLTDIKDDCNNDNSTLIRILLILLTLTDSENGWIIDGILSNKEIENRLLSQKRTGILGSILLEDTYIFKHIGRSSKNGRIYLSIHFKLYNENFICLFSLPSKELSEVENLNWDKEIELIKNNFIERINGTF